MNSYIIKIFHGYNKSKTYFKDFLDNIGKTLKNQKMYFGLNYQKGEFFYSVSTGLSNYSAFESQFYTYFNDFQIGPDNKGIWDYDPARSVLGEIVLENKGFYPFKMENGDSADFINSIFRSFDNFDLINDKLGFVIEITPLVEESIYFYIKSRFEFWFFKIGLLCKFFKYMFNYKIQKDWKKIGDQYFNEKLNKELFTTRVFIVAQSGNKQLAEGKIRSVFNNFLIFKNYPLNEFELKVHYIDIDDFLSGKINLSKVVFSSEEISYIFNFPMNPKNETSLLKGSSKKLALPVGIPTFDYEVVENNEVIPKDYPQDINILGISDYRSIKVPIGIHDEDRLRHMYVIGKTGVGKSKFLSSLIINDILQGRGICIIDPHGDLIEEALMYIPPDRKEDVVIFDPTDEKYPFSLNPLDIKEEESKQILAKGFIDIFKKYFGANRNNKLEHVLRMVFLALLDREGSTLFDIIRALTDKDFRYDMIEKIQDDVVKNFWTNEFAGWSQQFNTEAIMPILNKVGQLLSIDALKNIFGSKENKLDFRLSMDSKKILFIKLPKGKLQEEIMGFLGAMFVTKIYQAAMGRQSVSKDKRTPFFVYIDEFQNFATDTFSEILSEARKYGLGMILANQFMKQIPVNISDAIFGNVGSLISFRISTEDALHIKDHFDPFLTSYDLSNLNQREFYIKMLVRGQVKDPFSLKSLYISDPNIDKDYIISLYEISRSKYCTNVEEKKKIIEETQKDVIEKIEEFAEPFI